MPVKNTLYLDGRITESEDIYASVETYVTVFVLISSEVYDVELCFVNLENAQYFLIPKDAVKLLSIQFISKSCFFKKKLHCSLPFVELDDKKTVIGGLCSTLRWCIKHLVASNPDHPSKNLLGFRGGCLVSCAENSLWTKFCELEFPRAVRETAQSIRKADVNGEVPECLLKLESHLRAPVKTHNISKRTQKLVKELKRDNNTNVDSLGKELCKKLSLNTANSHSGVRNGLNKINSTSQFSLNHCYLEGIDFTLADVVIIPCVKLMLEYLPKNTAQNLEFVQKWLYEVLQLQSIQKAVNIFGWSSIEIPSCDFSHKACCSGVQNDTDENLYSKSSSVPLGKTKNLNPAPVISMLKEKGIEPHFVENKLPSLQWDQLPPALHPTFGDLPLKRVKRKCEQLQNMVSAVCKVARTQNTIVDFCSGGGHVGLLLAYFLPDCQIFLVENKEESMLRARKRALALNLDNIRFYQCNLDYFNCPFDVGVSLHACGVATDLVMEKCISKSAAFVCCPCCYGAVQEIDNLAYPLSAVFQDVPIIYKEYILLAHCADRTEKNTAKLHEGIYCMGLIDTDRLLHAKECGYSVQLMKMEPATCSPKHNLLIGEKIS